MYGYDNSSRSPGSQRHQQQTLHRQASRQFDGYGPMPSQGGLYTAEDHARFEGPRYGDNRMNATMHGNFGAYDMSGAQSWNAAGFGHNNTMAALGGTSRMKPSLRGRSALPAPWLDQHQPQQMSSMNPFPGLGSAILGGPSLREPHQSDPDEELIPTAIVIKNIPFAVKKEQLVQVMTEMRLPLPYAFNYHFDNGVFRGLAFANFTTAEETAVVIEALNHYELAGRKLRVEYKKMLPLAERERIEREKRERRGQLEEQHRPMTQLHTQPSISSISSHIPATSPSPVSIRNLKPGPSGLGFPPASANGGLDVDLNDPQALQFYSQLLLFKEDVSRDMLAFASTLTPQQRRTVHTLAHHMGLAHVSKGNGDQRQVHIYRVQAGATNMSPPMPQIPSMSNTEAQRRGLNRAATTDFSDVRGSDGFFGLGRQASGYLGFPESPGGLTAGPNLRAAKSYADLRSYTPSPVPSTASFPATLSTNISRFAEYTNSASSNTPTMTPVGTMSNRDEGLLSSTLGGLSLGSGFGTGGSPRGLRGMASWDRESNHSNPGPIGGHRSFSTNIIGESGERQSALRQPRGPLPERGMGFGPQRQQQPRQNGHRGRGSDELSSQSGVEIIVE